MRTFNENIWLLHNIYEAIHFYTFEWAIQVGDRRVFSVWPSLLVKVIFKRVRFFFTFQTFVISKFPEVEYRMYQRSFRRIPQDPSKYSFRERCPKLGVPIPPAINTHTHTHLYISGNPWGAIFQVGSCTLNEEYRQCLSGRMLQTVTCGRTSPSLWLRDLYRFSMTFYVEYILESASVKASTAWMAVSRWKSTAPRKTKNLTIHSSMRLFVYKNSRYIIKCIEETSAWCKVERRVTGDHGAFCE